MAAAARSRQEWRTLVDELEHSGERVGAFAARVGVNARTLSWWRWKLGTASASRETPVAPTFLPVVVAPSEPSPRMSPTGPIEFDLPNGVVVRAPEGMDIAQAVALATALGRAA